MAAALVGTFAGGRAALVHDTVAVVVFAVPADLRRTGMGGSIGIVAVWGGAAGGLYSEGVPVLVGTPGSTVAERVAVAADVGTTISPARAWLITPTAGGRLAAALVDTFTGGRAALVHDRVAVVVFAVPAELRRTGIGGSVGIVAVWGGAAAGLYTEGIPVLIGTRGSTVA